MNSRDRERLGGGRGSWKLEVSEFDADSAYHDVPAELGADSSCRAVVAGGRHRRAPRMLRNQSILGLVLGHSWTF